MLQKTLLTTIFVNKSLNIFENASLLTTIFVIKSLNIFENAALELQTCRNNFVSDFTAESHNIMVSQCVRAPQCKAA